MKVSDGSPVGSINSGITYQAVPYRTGDVVVVQVQASHGLSGECRLKFPNGELLTAVLKDRLPVREGDYITIKIQGNNESKIYAEIVKNQEILKVNKNSVAFSLLKLNIKNTPENYMIASHMIKNNILFTKENFDKIFNLSNKYKKISVGQLAFLFKNKIEITDENILSIYSFLNHEYLLGNKLILLVKSLIPDFENNELKNMLRQFFINPGNDDFNAEDLNPKEIIKKLVSILKFIKTHYVINENESIEVFLNNLYAQLDLIKKLQYIMQYLQIPININGNFDTVEFYHKKSKKFKRIIYLKIPTSKLGIIGMFVLIDSDNRVECHFKAEKSVYLKHIKKQIIKLYDLLSEIGFRLVKVTYNKILSDISIHNFHINADLLINNKGFDERM